MKKLIHINNGYKCPICKKYGLKPMYLTVNHRDEIDRGLLICKNCYAQFINPNHPEAFNKEEIKQILKKNQK